jgi:hypothetical protein
MPEAESAFAAAPEVEADPDAAFQGVMAELVVQFTELPVPDSGSVDGLLTEAFPAPFVAAEAAERTSIVEDLYPGLAYELNRQSDGLGGLAAPEPPVVVSHGYWEVADVGSLAIEDEAIFGPPTQAEEPAEHPDHRLKDAVRLTGQAVHAWLSLLQAPSVAFEADVNVLSR